MISTNDWVEALQAETKRFEEVKPSSIQSLANENTDTKREEEKNSQLGYRYYLGARGASV